VGAGLADPGRRRTTGSRHTRLAFPTFSF
jgi:hypothetical protein